MAAAATTQHAVPSNAAANPPSSSAHNNMQRAAPPARAAAAPGSHVEHLQFRQIRNRQDIKFHPLQHDLIRTRSDGQTVTSFKEEQVDASQLTWYNIAQLGDRRGNCMVCDTEKPAAAYALAVTKPYRSYRGAEQYMLFIKYMCRQCSAAHSPRVY
jgi:hypothetical protein